MMTELDPQEHRRTLADMDAGMSAGLFANRELSAAFDAAWREYYAVDPEKARQLRRAVTAWAAEARERAQAVGYVDGINAQRNRARAVAEDGTNKAAFYATLARVAALDAELSLDLEQTVNAWLCEVAGAR